MRLALAPYNVIKECKACGERNEESVASYILCFQVANYFLTAYVGEWEMEETGVSVKLKDLNDPLVFEFESGTVLYKTLVCQLYSRYSPDQGIRGLAEGICRDFELMLDTSSHGYYDPMFNLFVKLIEIFHARCGLCIKKTSNTEGHEVWELSLGQPGTEGWIYRDGSAVNRFGEKVQIEQWFNLRPEKMATNLFGFNRYCRHYPSPVKAE